MKTVFRAISLAAFVGLLLSGIPNVEAADAPMVQGGSTSTIPDDTHFKSGEPVEADSFYQLQHDMEPNGISSGPATGCPFDEEAIGQPLLG